MKNILALISLFLMTGCAEVPSSEPIVLDYSNLGKIYLDVADLSIINRAENTPRMAPYVGHRFDPTLSDAVYRLIGDRLQAAGSLGHATLIIKDANVTEQPLATASDFESFFTRQQASKYIGRVEVVLEAQSPQDSGVGITEAHAVYSVSLPENPTSYEKYEAYRRLLNHLITELNKELERGIHAHMSHFLVSTRSGQQTRQPVPSSTRDSMMPSMLNER